MIYNMCLGFKRLGHDVTLAAAEEYAPAEKKRMISKFFFQIQVQKTFPAGYVALFS